MNTTGNKNKASQQGDGAGIHIGIQANIIAASEQIKRPALK
jgi:hypothetical protein